jgi:hypothetical protein
MTGGSGRLGGSEMGVAGVVNASSGRSANADDNENRVCEAT